MLFLPNDDKAEAESIKIVEEVAKAEGLTVRAWRDVPVDHDVVGRFAKVTQPRIKQVFLESSAGLTGDALERELYLARKAMENQTDDRLGEFGQDFFMCSMSGRTIVYKVSSPGYINGSGAGCLALPPWNCCFQNPLTFWTSSLFRACCGQWLSDSSTRTW